MTPYSAEVLITDPNYAIPAQVSRNGLRTIALGSGQIDRLSLPYLSGSADIRPGDLLVTSGMDGIFPQGYPVATAGLWRSRLICKWPGMRITQGWRTKTASRFRRRRPAADNFPADSLEVFPEQAPDFDAPLAELKNC